MRRFGCTQSTNEFGRRIVVKHANDRNVWINLRDRMPHARSARERLNDSNNERG